MRGFEMPDERVATAWPSGPPKRLPSLVAMAREVRGRLQRTGLELNEYGFDRFGFHPGTAARLLLPGALLYRYYFRVETHGIERVPEGPLMVVANHSGQVGYDGGMLFMSLLLDAEPPRLPRGMGEFFFWRNPWLGTLASRTGTLAGTPDNCTAVLRSGGCVMVFPEGARGANKPFRKRYQLQRFGSGFMRLALETGASVLPVGIVGAEEQQPGIANLEGLGRWLGLPSFPITVTAPWFGPLGMAFALPVKYHIHFGSPLRFEGDPDGEEEAVDARVDVVKQEIAKLLEDGLAARTGIFA